LIAVCKWQYEKIGYLVYGVRFEVSGVRFQWGHTESKELFDVRREI
jgi:hypothetical protein